MKSLNIAVLAALSVLTSAAPAPKPDTNLCVGVAIITSGPCAGTCDLNCQADSGSGPFTTQTFTPTATPSASTLLDTSIIPSSVLCPPASQITSGPCQGTCDPNCQADSGSGPFTMHTFIPPASTPTPSDPAASTGPAPGPLPPASTFSLGPLPSTTPSDPAATTGPAPGPLPPASTFPLGPLPSTTPSDPAATTGPAPGPLPPASTFPLGPLPPTTTPAAPTTPPAASSPTSAPNPSGFPAPPPNTVYVSLSDSGFSPSSLSLSTGAIVIIAIEGTNQHGVRQSALDDTCTFQQGGLQFGPMANPVPSNVLQTTYAYTVPTNFNGITFFDPSAVSQTGGVPSCPLLQITPV